MKYVINPTLFFLFFSVKLWAQQPDTLTVYFNSGQAQLSDQATEELQLELKKIDSNRVESWALIGYCDDQGSEAYNMKLAKKRIACVEQHMFPLGKSKKKLDVKGEVQLVNNDVSVSDQRRSNRKVLVVVYQWSSPVRELNMDQIEIGEKAVLENILFKGGRSDFLAESYPALEGLVLSLKKNPEIHIKIYGHICCQTKMNLDGIDQATGKQNLSSVRAKAVYRYLIRKGIHPDRLKFRGMKGDYPTGRGAKYDRRVEIEITKR